LEEARWWVFIPCTLHDHCSHLTWVAFEHSTCERSDAFRGWGQRVSGGGIAGSLKDTDKDTPTQSNRKAEAICRQSNARSESMLP
jgi:hypothetical protein